VSTAASPATRPRPSMWWLAGPMVVFLITLVPVGFMVLRLVELSGTDAVVPLDGATHEVRVEPDDDRMIWVDVHAPTPKCQVRDARSGDRLELHRVSLKTVRERENGDESGRWQFDPGSGDLTISCSSATPGTAAIGAAVTGRIMLTSFLPWFLLAMLLSAVWIGWLAVLVVKLARKSAEPPPPPAWTRPD